MMKLLSDAEVQSFICNGFLILKPDIDAEVHGRVDQELRHVIEQEFVFGNNILPRIPGLFDVIDSPAVAGALTSLLGEGYVLYPHRAVHSSTPVELAESVDGDSHAPRMGKGSMAGSGWHQDAQSPLARGRYHTPWSLILFYFPHDTPREMGPTRLQAGSYMNSRPMRPVQNVVFPEFIEAGTCVLLHFDMVHAGFPSATDLTRYMVKFVFNRTERPRAPTWHSESPDWVPPDDNLVEDPMEAAWRANWHWLRGERFPPQIESADLSWLDHDDQPFRLRGMYSHASVSMIPELKTSLLNKVGSGREERNLRKDEDGKAIPQDDVTREPRWNERAIVFEDEAYTLAAIGEAALDTLIEVTAMQDPWLKINGCFGLGEIGVQEGIPAITQCLSHEQQQVVRQAIEALGQSGCVINDALPAFETLLIEANPEWQAGLVLRGWVAQDQVRLNIVMALLNAINVEGNDIVVIERLLGLALHSDNGYQTALACEGLARIGSATALQMATQYLQRQQFDSSLKGNARLY